MVGVVVGEGVEGRSSYWGVAARGCDSCKGSPAVLFCRTDSAFLCGACDVRVHGGGGGKLASRHERVWMCEVCEQAPAAVTCKADAAALCVSCDADIHSANPLARRHERVPVVPFYEYSSAAGLKGAGQDLLPKLSGDDEDDDGVHGSREAEAASWLLPNPNLAAINSVGHHPHEAKFFVDGPELKMEDDFLFPDVDRCLDPEYSSLVEPRYHRTDSVVPVQTAAAVHPPFVAPNGCCIDFDFDKASRGSYIPTPSLSYSISSSDVGVVPDAGAMADITNPYGGHGGTPAPAPPAAVAAWMDREARVMRYREKRKNRKFEKTIRYASRKAYAETRPRIKGRFAKRTEVEAEEADHFYSSAAAAASFVTRAGYSVVPSF